MPWMRRLCPDFGRCGCAAAFGNASYRLFIDTERRRCALTDAEVRTTQTRAEKKRHGAGDASACAELDFFFLAEGTLDVALSCRRSVLRGDLRSFSTRRFRSGHGSVFLGCSRSPGTWAGRMS